MFLILFSNDLIAQYYQVQYSTTYDPFDDSITIDYLLVSDKDSVSVNGTDTTVILGRPKALFIFNSNYTCSNTEVINLVNGDCNYFFDSSYSTTCVGTISIDIRINPVLKFQSGTTPDSSIICLEDNVKIIASSGFSTYSWYYKSSAGIFTPLYSGSGNEASITLQDLVGSNYIPYLNKKFYFTYTVGNCNDLSVTPILHVQFAPHQPLIANYTINEPSCNGRADGSFEVTELNRSLYQGEILLYSLYRSLETITYANDPKGVFSGLKAGDYRISIGVYDSLILGFCDSLPDFEFTINEPTPVQIESIITSPVICKGSSTGAAKIKASGGKGGTYTFSLDGGTFTNDSIFTSLSATTAYGILAMDSNNCQVTESFIVPEPQSPLSATANILTNFLGYNISCYDAEDGKVEINPTGGWGDFKFSSSASGPFLGDSVFTNLGAGISSFWVQDSLGCIEPVSVTLSVPDSIRLSPVITQPSCLGDVGQLDFVATGGIGTIGYSVNGDPFQPAPFFLLAGKYSIGARDSMGCMTLLDSVQIVDPLPISYTLTFVQPTCATSTDGVISVTNTINGIPPYQYSLNGGATYQASVDFIGVGANTYTLMIKDAANCISSSFLELVGPDPVTGIINETSISCFGVSDGALEVQPTGGSGTYSFSWSDNTTSNPITNLGEGNYSVIITDENGCQSDPIYYSLSAPTEILVTTITSEYNGFNVSCADEVDGSIELLVTGGVIKSEYNYEWAKGDTTRIIDSLQAGNYFVEVSDDNGCAVNLQETLTAPQKILITDALITDVYCFGNTDGSIILDANGGTGVLQYSLDGSPYQSDGNFINLSAGDHIISIKDLNDCYLDSLLTISSPENLEIISSNISNTTCNTSNGSVGVGITGGTSPYSYQWKDDVGNLLATTQNIMNLKGGTYTLLVSDANGCTLEKDFMVSDSDGPSISLAYVTQPICHGSSDASAEISVAGGVPPYNIEWSNGISGVAATGLVAGIYSVSVADANNCLSYMDVEIIDQDQIMLTNIIVSEPTCHGDNDGQLKIDVIGGIPPYNIQWGNGTSGVSNSNLLAGLYDVTITDANDCVTNQQLQLNEPEELTLNMNITLPTCELSADGKILLNPTGGNTPYFLIYDTDTLVGNYLDSLSPGVYIIQLIDANGCNLSQEAIIDNPSPPIIELEDIVICEGQVVEVASPISGIAYRWYQGVELIGNSADILLDVAAHYQLEVDLANGCLVTGIFDITTSNEVLQSQFLVSSTALAKDTLIVIDISFPIPDSTQWNFPTEADVIFSSNDYVLVVFEQPGTYAIGMETFLGTCHKASTTSVEILDSDISNPGGRLTSEQNPLFISTELYPNPSNGIFKVISELSLPIHLHLQIISLSTNKLVYESTSSESEVHTMNVQLPFLAAGVYAVALQAGNETRVMRMMVK